MYMYYLHMNVKLAVTCIVKHLGKTGNGQQESKHTYMYMYFADNR